MTIAASDWIVFPPDLEILQECRADFRGTSRLAEGHQRELLVGTISPTRPSTIWNFISEEVGCPLQMISVGPRRDQTIVLSDVF